jgi:bifunctional non-homologous end joining protein LigD
MQKATVSRRQKSGRARRGPSLIRRKQILRQTLPAVPGLAFFDAVAKAGLEGMIAKDGSSKYLAGRRSDCWPKVKATLLQEAVISGFTRPRGSRQHFGSPVLGAPTYLRMREERGWCAERLL